MGPGHQASLMASEPPPGRDGVRGEGADDTMGGEAETGLQATEVPAEDELEQPSGRQSEALPLAEEAGLHRKSSLRRASGAAGAPPLSNITIEADRGPSQDGPQSTGASFVGPSQPAGFHGQAQTRFPAGFGGRGVARGPSARARSAEGGRGPHFMVSWHAAAQQTVPDPGQDTPAPQPGPESAAVGPPAADPRRWGLVSAARPSTGVLSAAESGTASVDSGALEETGPNAEARARARRRRAREQAERGALLERVESLKESSEQRKERIMRFERRADLVAIENHPAMRDNVLVNARWKAQRETKRRVLAVQRRMQRFEVRERSLHAGSYDVFMGFAKKGAFIRSTWAPGR